MDSRLVYLDQNIVSYQAHGRIDLADVTDVQWVYSAEHFAEIRRSDNPDSYLSSLDDIGARKLEIELSNWTFSGSATLVMNGSAREQYGDYIQSVEDVPLDMAALNVFVAWLNGGASIERLYEVPDAMGRQLDDLVADLPIDLISQNLHKISSDFRNTIAGMASHGNAIEKTRGALGVGKGAAGSVTGDNPIGQIWEKISPNVPDQTCDQFFGFKPLKGLGQSPWSDYEGIVRCCAMLDIVGYQSEQKSRDPEQVENVNSDAAHIAAASFCSAIMSADKRLAQRAKAIYEYKSVLNL